MDISDFAAFYKAQGFRVIRTESCFWFEASKFFYQSIPFHRPVSPSRAELNKIFFGGPAAGVRYISNGAGRESYIWMQEDRGYGFSALEGKARNQTRRGLENCRVEKVGFELLYRSGLSMVQQTLSRQGRSPETITESQWRLLCCACGEQPDFQAWAAFAEDRLVAFLIAGIIDRCFYILHQYSDSASLKSYPNNALIFEVTRRLICDPRIDCVSYGIESLDAEHTGGLDKFKISMGHKMKPIRQRVQFNPLIESFVGGWTYRAIKRVQRVRPESDFLRKLSGVINYHLGAKKKECDDRGHTSDGRGASRRSDQTKDRSEI